MKITRAFLALLVTIVAAAGCSSGTSVPPAAPTAVTADASAASGDAARSAIQVSGTAARVSGTCPALRLLVGRVTVQTGRSTVFTPGTCANVVNGAGVVATGARQSDGSLAAASIAVRGATSTR